jgi:hypothetical protein
MNEPWRIRLVAHSVQARQIALVHRDAAAARFYEQLAGDIETCLEFLTKMELERDELRELAEVPRPASAS